MLKFGLSAALFIAAAQALAQPQGAPAPQAPPSEIEQASRTFSQCIRTGVRAVPASVTPEAGATTVLAGCATQRQTLERLVLAHINGPAVPEPQKAAAREQLRTGMASAATQVTNAIRQSRTARPAQ